MCEDHAQVIDAGPSCTLPIDLVRAEEDSGAPSPETGAEEQSCLARAVSMEGVDPENKQELQVGSMLLALSDETEDSGGQDSVASDGNKLATRYTVGYVQMYWLAVNQVGYSSKVNYFVKPGKLKENVFAEELAKTEDADKEDGQREAMEKPAKVMSVTWMLRGAAKALPRMSLARSSWRIWDPGRGEVHVVLTGVIVRINHEPMPV